LFPDSLIRVQPYRPKWSLDHVQAMAGFSNIDGVGGQAALSFSDLMGDQELLLWLYADGGGLSNINALAGYSYLPLRPDFSISLGHFAEENTELISEVENGELTRFWMP
jgi:hypothetical protein